MTCSESTGNAVSFSNQEGVTALLDSTGTEGLSEQRAAHRPGVNVPERLSGPGCQPAALRDASKRRSISTNDWNVVPHILATCELFR